MSSSTNSDAFSFDTVFGEDGTVLQEGGQKYRRYTQTELDEAVAAARAEAIASVEAETQRQIAANVKQIAEQLMPSLPFAMALADQLRHQSAELTLMLARKIADAAIDAYPKEAVQACLSAALDDLPGAARITLKISPQLEEAVRPVLERLTTPETEINLVADPSAPPGAWSIEWDKGAITHNPELLAEKLEEIVRNYLTNPLEPQGDLFAGVA